MYGWTRDVPGAAQHRNHHGDGRWIVPFSTSGAIASVLGAQASGFYVEDLKSDLVHVVVRN